MTAVRRIGDANNYKVDGARTRILVDNLSNVFLSKVQQKVGTENQCYIGVIDGSMVLTVNLICQVMAYSLQNNNSVYKYIL